MVALVRSRQLDFGDEDPDSARGMIKALLAVEPTATRKVYAALAHKVWMLLIERRLDAELRDWQALLHGVRAHVRGKDEAVSERMVALADLLRESISLAETSPARDIAQRPHARRIIELLGASTAFTPRRALLEALGIGTSHLSNILGQLVMHDLIERKGNGKEAEFRLTALGRQVALGGALPSVAADGSPLDDIAASFAAIDILLDNVPRGVAPPPVTPANDLFDQIFLYNNAIFAEDPFHAANSHRIAGLIPRPAPRKYASAYDN